MLDVCIPISCDLLGGYPNPKRGVPADSNSQSYVHKIKWGELSIFGISDFYYFPSDSLTILTIPTIEMPLKTPSVGFDTSQYDYRLQLSTSLIIAFRRTLTKLTNVR